MASTVRLLHRQSSDRKDSNTNVRQLVNWEYPCDPQQGDDFLALLAAVRNHLPEERFVLTAALPAAISVLQNIDLCVAGEYLDLLNLAAYDFYGAWTPKCGHHAQLYSMSKDESSGAAGVQYVMSQGFPAKKILLGIPVFGRSFLNTSGPGHKFKGVGGEDGTIEYRNLPRKHTKEQVDKRTVAAQCVGGDSGFVSYDNQDTVKMKAAFCKQKGLGVSPHSSPPLNPLVKATVEAALIVAVNQGLFYWTAPADAKDSKRSLVAAGFRALHGL